MKKLLTTLLLTSSLSIVFAQPNYSDISWQTWNEGAVPSRGARTIIPAKGSIHYVNAAQLKARLYALPAHQEEAQVISIPAPDGSLRTFRVWQEPMMEEALAAKYPDIKTFSGYAADNRLVTLKLDHTESGFHAMVLDGSKTYFIDPYSDVNDGFYNCYYKRDYIKPLGQTMQCGVSDETREFGNPIQLTPSGLPDLKFRTHGLTKRTFRLALACTGEYAVAVAGPSPTKAAVLGKMVTTVNRVNGVYERELAVHMNLVANEDTLVFLDGSTDPYNNSTGWTEFTNNQTTIDARIGTANYDIGHLFSTSAGGIAMLGSVCKSDKAQGLTGSGNPQGDPFDIDYVAHEMGHQFGADHTFNANTGSCAGGNGVQSQAYEPGGGSTIMAYAGICGAVNNLQLHSDAYFHAISLVKITDFLTSPSGATCAVPTPSVNVPPVVAPFTQSYQVPMLTPFELTAPPVTDVDHDTLTYCWEQWNLGNFMTSWTAPSTHGPIFRSFEPDTSGTRVFPRIDKVLAGTTSYLGEKLPDVTRFLTFKLTVRDIFNGIGTFNFPDDTVHLDVTASAGPFRVLSPATPVNWMGNSQQTVTWDVAGTSNAPVSCANVDIYMSEDGGYTYPYLVVANTPNDGSEQITVPNLVTTNQARIKVKGSGNVFFNVNTTDFSVTHNTSGVQQVRWYNDINIYPVPATDLLYLVSDNNLKLQVHIVNAVGQKLYSGLFSKKLVIPVSTWAKGIYYIQLADALNGEKIVRPVVIN